jgi:phosphoribosyl-ATP pyrophosphohydrolase
MNDFYAVMVRTLTSPRCHLSRVDVDDLEQRLKDFAAAASQLDELKRVLFYGILNKLEPVTPATAYETVHSDTLHGIIGVATEAGELVERLISMALEPDKDHKTNLIEELGDLLFYLTLVMSANGLSFEAVLQANAAKLQERYAGKFTHLRALHRNLGAETGAMQRGLR